MEFRDVGLGGEWTMADNDLSHVDALIDQARSDLDQERRKRVYAEIQQLLAVDQPYVYLWYQDNVMVHSQRVRNLTLDPSGNYDFLKTAELAK